MVTEGVGVATAAFTFADVYYVPICGAGVSPQTCASFLSIPSRTILTYEFVYVTLQDVVATSAYVPYGTYVRDYRPPTSNRNPEYTMVRVGGGYNCGLPDPLYSSVAPLPNSMLNVSDPRLSATYGNPHLRQVWYCQKAHPVPRSSK